MPLDDEAYVPINVDILGLTAKAVHVRCADNVRRWIPRSLIFGPDEISLPKQVGQLIRLRVFKWFASKNTVPIARGI